MIKLIAIDMDGTLLDSQKQLPEKNVLALHQAVAKGVQIVLCTGRPKSGVQPYFEELGLSQDASFAILDNGCTTYRTEDWSLLDYKSLSQQDIADLAATATDFDGVDVTYFDSSHYFILGDEIPELVSYDAGLVFNTVTPTNIADLKASPVPIFQGMFMGQPEALDAFEAAKGAELSQKFSMVRSQSYIYEAMPLGTTKASALKALTEHLGLTAEEVMAIGDAANDIEMLEYAGLSVAMGNASDEVKALADVVTADHDACGVAQAIERFVL